MITWFREASLDILTQFIHHDDLHQLMFIRNDTNQANYYVFQESLNYRVKAVRREPSSLAGQSHNNLLI